MNPLQQKVLSEILALLDGMHLSNPKQDTGSDLEKLLVEQRNEDVEARNKVREWVEALLNN